MCGIAGIISPQTRSQEMEKMLQQQSHRGPDHTGIYTDPGHAVLGHNRLSIIDLSSEANEPFQDPSGRYYLTFNGEIYNYLELREELKDHCQFKTASDSEVLLAAFIIWGKECLHRFNGMFSFAIWDSGEKVLFAARDRFGVKPFHYSIEGNTLYFSSEIKAIQAVLQRNSPNKKVWANYFCYGSYGAPDETFFEGIHQLPGGHCLEFKAGKMTVERWYDFLSRVKKIETDHSFEEAKEKYLALLIDSIRLRFRADVPVGFNLSGGVDSSLLLALVNRTEEGKNSNAYTFYTGDERYDELPWVEQMIATTGNPLHNVKLSAGEVPALAKKIAALQDEPYGGIPTLAYSKIFEQAQKDGIKVLLDGQGMDEQWAGYDYYLRHAEARFIASPPVSTIQGTGTNSPFKPAALSPEFAALAEKPSYPTPFNNRLQNLQYRDLFYTKIPRALRFNDRISMANSTELREPFLDYRLVEFAFAQPESFKIHNGIQKYLIRELLKPMVPESLSYAPKRALQTPQREWLGEELKDLVEFHLDQLRTSPYQDWFNFNEIIREWQSYKEGNNESSFHLWQWINATMVLQKP